jgi:hypothetical protein
MTCEKIVPEVCFCFSVPGSVHSRGMAELNNFAGNNYEPLLVG